MRPIFPALLFLALAACTGDARKSPGDAAAVPDSARYGGTLVIGAATDIGDIDPLTWNVQNALYMQESVLFTPLIAYDSLLRPIPRPARRRGGNGGSTLLTFHLRADVWWQDGVRTSAHDVKLTYDLLRNPKTGYIYSGLWTFYGEAEAPDSFTFRIRLRPHA